MTKTYVLLPNMDADAPVYQQLPNGSREKIKKIPWHRPTLRQTFQDKDGVGMTIRYKSASKFIDQAKQIAEEKLDANEPFTKTERRDCEFRFGILTTSKLKAQEYLEAHPEFEGFLGTCDDVPMRRYRLLDETVDVKNLNEETRKRLKAGNKIFTLELQAAQELLIRLNGSFFETPSPKNYTGTEEEKNESAKQECQNMLMAFMDDTNDAGLDAILKDEINIDEKTTVLIGSCINAGILSFNEVEGQVSKKQGDKWVSVKEISSEYEPEQRKIYFAEFLTSADGKLLANDLAKELKTKK